jgi:CRISPR-associated protein Csm1
VNQQRMPTLEETVLGAFLHDIGKFMQRALAKARRGDRAPTQHRQRIVCGTVSGAVGAFVADFRKACGMPNTDLFFESLLSISERYTFAVPSSTMDQPDIPLHDHSRAVAAVAAALYRWHAAQRTLGELSQIQDRRLRKFRFVAGDLSGIQDALFRLAAQRVRGVNKILRARSFLLSMLVEAGALHTRRALGLPVFSMLQAAGGRFLILAPATPDLDERLENARREIDHWVMERYLGELALNLGVTEAFAGEDLALKKFPAVQAALRRAAEEAKLQPLRRAYRATHQLEFQRGAACSACGVRPGEYGEEGALRCSPCEDEHRLGGDLPKVDWVRWSPGGRGKIGFFGSLTLDWHPTGQEQPRPNAAWVSAFRLWRDTETLAGELPLRFVANYVPRWDGTLTPLYRELLSEETLEEALEEAERGGVKLFEMLAADAVEPVNGQLAGEAMLAVLKADVDRLGRLFATGWKDPSLARFATLSRMLDFFFTGQLQWLLRREFPSTYTVYAGGDDLLVIGPWRQMLRLAKELRRQFDHWTGGNPNVSLSAAVELLKPYHPLNRAARAAQERLEQAKTGGRNRISVIDPAPASWELYDDQLERAEELSRLLQNGTLSTVFVHKLLALDNMRRRAEDHRDMDLNAAAWRARWRYLRARRLEQREDLPPSTRESILRLLDTLLGLCGKPATARTAVSIALYPKPESQTEEVG